MATEDTIAKPPEGRSEEMITPRKEKTKNSMKSPIRSISSKFGKKSKKSKSKGDEDSSVTSSNQAPSSTDSDIHTDDELSVPGTPKIDISEIQENSLLHDTSLTPETAEDMDDLVPPTPPQIQRLNEIANFKGSKVATVYKAEKSTRVGITFRSSSKSTDVVIANIADDGLFSDSVLRVGQKVISINGKSCDAASDAVILVKATTGELIIVAVDREEETPVKETVAAKLTNSLLESSFTGPDSTNATLEAAYLRAQKENNEILKKIKEMEEKAAAEEREKVNKIMKEANEGSALKWAQMSVHDADDDTKPLEESPMEAILQPILDEPDLPARKIDFGPKEEETTTFSAPQEKADATTKKWGSHLMRIVLLVAAILLYFAIMRPASKYRDNFDSALNEMKAFVSPHATACITHLEKMRGDASVFMGNEVSKVNQFLEPAKSSTILYATSVLTHLYNILDHISKYAEIGFTKVKIILGLELDLGGDILPLGQRYMGTDSETPLCGMNVVITKAASEVGMGLAKALSQLGAKVVAVDASAEKLAGLKAEENSLMTVVVDLEDLASVSRAADSIVDSLGYVDVLVNNAGGYLGKRNAARETEQGYDRYFGVNYLSEFLFTAKLLEPLKRSSRGSIIQVSSMAHVRVNGSDLEIDTTEKQPQASVPGAIAHLRAYPNSLLAGILHNRYLSRTEKDLRVASLFPTALTTPLRVRSVLYHILEDADKDSEGFSTIAPLPSLLTLVKQKLTPPGPSFSPAENKDLQDDLYDWSENAVAPYWWMNIVPQTREILREAGHEVIHPSEEGFLSKGFYHGSVATFLSISSYSLFRRFVVSTSSES